MTNNEPAHSTPLDDLLRPDPAPDTAAAVTPSLDFDTDDEFGEPALPRRIPRLTLFLGLCLGMALAFTGGVLVQKHYATASSAAGLPTGFPSGLGGSGFPTGLGGSGGGSGGSTSTTGAAAGPAVIGTVVSVSGTDVTVQDLGGTKHIVHTTKTTTVTRSTTVRLSDLSAGVTVRVDGTTASDGAITATTVTTR
jgi:hypothetical protein